MERRFLLAAGAVSILLVCVLRFEQAGVLPQLIAGGITTIALVALTITLEIPKRQILTAVVVATIGEVLLSVVWGLYDYQHALIPLYVPPGHGIFYALAAGTAQQSLLRRHARGIFRGVVVAGSLVAAVGFFAFGDQWGLLWWLAALALLLTSRRKLLLSACFTWTMLLEWLGTALGNWRWAAEVPGLGLHSANPPSGVGILYIALDLLVVLLAGTAAGEEDDRPDGELAPSV
jgi:hypothetical protein